MDGDDQCGCTAASKVSTAWAVAGYASEHGASMACRWRPGARNMESGRSRIGAADTDKKTPLDRGAADSGV